MACNNTMTGPDQDVLRELGKSFVSIADRMKSRKAISDKLLILSEELPKAMSKISGHHSQTHDRWTTAFANTSGTIAESLQKLQKKNKFSYEDVSNAIDLANGVDRLSYLMVQGVESCVASRSDSELSEQEREKLGDLTDVLIGDTTDKAFKLYIAAKRIFYTAGVSGMPGSSFFYPAAKKRARPTELVSTQPSFDEEFAPPIAYDEKELRKQIANTNVLASVLTDYLNALGHFLLAVPAVLRCYNECPLWSEWQIPPKLTRYGAEPVGTEGYKSWFEITWEYCAYNFCWMLWWDTWIIEVKKIHKVNGVVNHTGRDNKTIAEIQAKNVGEQVISSFGPGPPTGPTNVTPPVNVPSVPEWFGGHREV